jgi:hypothetical protein
MAVGRIVFSLHRFDDVPLLTKGKFFRFGGTLKSLDKIPRKAYLDARLCLIPGALEYKSLSHLFPRRLWLIPKITTNFPIFVGLSSPQE